MQGSRFGSSAARGPTPKRSGVEGFKLPLDGEHLVVHIQSLSIDCCRPAQKACETKPPSPTKAKAKMASSCFARRAISLLAAIAALTSPTAASTDVVQKPLLSYFECQHPPYRVQVVSKSPLVIYLHGFITPQEREHLQDVTKNTFTRSGVTPNDGSDAEKAIHQVRTSRSTSVSRDAVVRCIEDRALAFQGHGVTREHLEPLQLVKYGPGERYHFHTDWFTDPQHATPALGGNRLTSFFAYVAVSNSTTTPAEEGSEEKQGIIGGGTNFPLVDPPRGGGWCGPDGVIDCDEPWESGTTFRPVEGNAVYWENLYPNGVGDARNLHAGLPVTKGWKIGMNIWTRQGPLSEDMRAPDV
ncbi:hypothetical protein RB600_006850 [Gaeumannomyces tritici]